MYQTGPTIKQTLDDIQTNRIVLPAIQREFVWRPSQICRLFDSLMQGYPFNTFLYWQVDPENSGRFQFYDFVREYHEKDNPHCPRLPTMSNKQLTAVLDGQQRLTALNIGLRGSMAWKLPRFRVNSPWAYPTRKLYLDLLWQPDEDDENGLRYRFSFLREEQFKAAKTNDNVCWLPVSEVLAEVGVCTARRSRPRYPHCPRLPTMSNKQLTAVLDGQQRLTALNIGLRGSMAWKLPRFRVNSPWAYPTRKLYLDLLWQPDEDDENGLRYRFSFLREEQFKANTRRYI